MDQLAKCNRPSCGNQAHRSGGGYCVKHAYAAGAMVPYVDRDKAMTAVQDQLARGHSIWTLGKAAGLNHSTLYKFMQGPTSSWGADGMRQDTYQAVLDAPMLDIMNVPAWPARRRIQALRAAGKNAKNMAAEMGVSHSVVINVCREDRQSIRLWADRKIRAYYQQHQLDPVGEPAPGAAGKGWALPMQWIDIDDPQERRHRIKSNGSKDAVPVSPELIHATQFLRDRYGSWDDAADIVGVTFMPLSRIARGVQEKVSSEMEHRITYAASRDGWAPGLEVAA